MRLPIVRYYYMYSLSNDNKSESFELIAWDQVHNLYTRRGDHMQPKYFMTADKKSRRGSALLTIFKYGLTPSYFLDEWGYRITDKDQAIMKMKEMLNLQDQGSMDNRDIPLDHPSVFPRLSKKF